MSPTLREHTTDSEAGVVAQYHQDGFTRLGRALDRRQVAAFVRATDEAFARGRIETGPYGLMWHNLWREVPLVEALLRSVALSRSVRSLLGETRVTLFQDVLVWKKSGLARIEWHQDYSYWPLDAPHGVTLWVALDDADEDNGCLHYVSGSHLWGECQPADFVRGTDQPVRPDLPPLAWEAHEENAVAVPCRAGEAIVHHPLTWHMSPVNESGRERRAWSITWIAPQVRWDTEHAPHPFNFSLAPVTGAPLEGELFPSFP